MLIYLLCLVTPMFTNQTHSLYCHSYVFILFLLQIGLLLRLLSGPTKVDRRWLATMFGIGFLQGWFSFDYCFLVTFAPVPIALLVTPRSTRLPVRAVILLVLATGIGFTLAHALHFFQTVAYFGSLEGALKEYAERASKKYGLTGTSLDHASRLTMLFIGLSQMLVVLFRWTHILSPTSIAVVALTIAICVLSRFSATLNHRFRLDAHFQVRGSHILGLAASAALAFAWVVAKPYHAINHFVFIGRHWFLFYVACGLLITQATTLRIGWKRHGVAHWWPSRDVFHPLRSAMKEKQAEDVVFPTPHHAVGFGALDRVPEQPSPATGETSGVV
ncbi:MAG: hypothetical protein U0794_01545 [Isosphaeraceae bacterium]